MSDKFWITLQVDDEVKRKLQAIAYEEDRSMSASIRQMINEKYDQMFVTIPMLGKIYPDGTISIKEELERN